MIKSSANGQWVKNCKICSLFITHKELWIELHDKVLKQKEPNTVVMKWFATRAAHLNALLEDPNDTSDPKYLVPLKAWNMQSHFVGSTDTDNKVYTGHATDFYAVRRLIQGKEDKQNVEAIIEANSVIPEPKDVSAQNEKAMDEYLSLSSMVGNLEDVLRVYDQDFKDRIAKGGKINLKDIESYQRQVQGLIDIKIKMGGLRNTTSITGAAVQTAIELITTQFLEKLIVVVGEAEAMLTAEMRGSSMPKEISHLILHTEKDAMKAAIPIIHNQVLSQYKIKSK